ncbi:MAG: hypothetical protein AAF317_20810 [Pseudomonadota bacterium]
MTFLLGCNTLMWVVRQAFIRTALIWILQKVVFWRTGDALEPAARYASIASEATQADVFETIETYDPRTTRFAVLPMDMALTGKGDVREDIFDQHRELATIARASNGRIIAFGTVDPRRDAPSGDLPRCVEDSGFRGIKLYPLLGLRRHSRF